MAQKGLWNIAKNECWKTEERHPKRREIESDTRRTFSVAGTGGKAEGRERKELKG